LQIQQNALINWHVDQALNPLLPKKFLLEDCFPEIRLERLKYLDFECPFIEFTIRLKNLVCYLIYGKYA